VLAGVSFAELQAKCQFFVRAIDGPQTKPKTLTLERHLYQKLNAFGFTVAAVYDRRWLTTPALIETPLQVKTAR
jgi:hypothetical protein